MQKPIVIWFTGLSGAGKSTLANALHQHFKKEKIKSIVLDGDELRKGINSNLGFSEQDRTENIRRAAEISKLFLKENYIVLSAFISPLAQMRELAKEVIGANSFLEIFVNCSLKTCENRDVKGHYKNVRNNKLANFTGIHQQYEAPINPNIIINTEENDLAQSVKLVLDYLSSQAV